MDWQLYEVPLIALATVAFVLFAHYRHRWEIARRAMRIEAAKARKATYERRAALTAVQEPWEYGTAFWLDPERWKRAPEGRDGRPLPFWMYQDQLRDYLRP
jgi:hypothetical protein